MGNAPSNNNIGPFGNKSSYLSQATDGTQCEGIEGVDSEFSKKLFEKAGIKMDKAEELLGDCEREKEEMEAKKRSLSPMADILYDTNERMPPMAQLVNQ